MGAPTCSTRAAGWSKRTASGSSARAIDMPRLAIIAGCCLLAVSVTVAGWQRVVISKTRQENKRLQQESQAATEQAKDARRIPELSVREPSHELLRLRNAVRQSREQARELAKLRQENEHLASVL